MLYLESVLRQIVAKRLRSCVYVHNYICATDIYAYLYVNVYMCFCQLSVQNALKMNTFTLMSYPLYNANILQHINQWQINSQE